MKYGRQYPTVVTYYQELILAEDGAYDVIISKEGLAPTRYEHPPFVVGRTGGVIVGTIRTPEGRKSGTITRCEEGRFWIPVGWL